MNIERFDREKHHCRMVVRGDMVYLAGLCTNDATLGPKEQTADVLKKIDSYLERAGTDKSKILSAIVWLRDMKDYDAYNEAWDAWVDMVNQPVRATVESRLAKPGYLVEIMVTAVK